jgi:hypothetical protein
MVTSQYAHFGYDYNTMKATAAPGTIMGYSKDGYPIRAAMAPGTIMGYSKDGYPIRAASVFDDIACGGSTILFVGLGLLVGWLAADKATDYMSKKRV